MTTVLSSLTSNKLTMLLCHPNSFPCSTESTTKDWMASLPSSDLIVIPQHSSYSTDKETEKELRRDTYIRAFVYQIMKIVANIELQFP